MQTATRCVAHEVCRELNGISGLANAASVLITEKYYNQFWVALGGHEVSGQYAGSYSLPGGRMDADDYGCYVRTALRELWEEVRIQIRMEDFDKYFRKSNGSYRYILVGYGKKTPVFYCRKRGLSRRGPNDQLALAQRDQSLPVCMKEMDRVEWIRFEDGLTPENVTVRISPYLRDVMKRIRDEGRLNELQE